LHAETLNRPALRAGAQASLTALRESDVRVSADAPGGRAEYRNSLAASFLFKAWARVSLELEKDAPGYTAPLPAP
jgi:hypothetical protein